MLALSYIISTRWSLHRFPSSFFIPSRGVLNGESGGTARREQAVMPSVRMRFVRSEFRGLLPGNYDASLPFPDVTRRVPRTQNDQNKEETDRYVNVDECDYMVDLQTVRVNKYPQLSTDMHMIFCSRGTVN